MHTDDQKTQNVKPHGENMICNIFTAHDKYGEHRRINVASYA
jgi:hypothetical protein